jgi:mono/diheme cytochrome c family protein
MKKVLLTFAILFVLLVALAFTLIYTGAYDVSAARPEGSLTRWALSTMMEHSVKRHADDIVVPSLDDSALVSVGYDHYSEMCVSCHGSPAGGQSEAGRGLNPPAPDLSQTAKTWRPADLYWILKNGIKMTGMPAFGPTHDERELWGIVAFVQKLREMSPEKYKAFSSEATNSEEPPREGPEKAHHHPVAEIGKGPHGGTIEEAGPMHIEIVAGGSDLIFYLLDGDARPLDMKDVRGSVKIQYADASGKTISLMEMAGKLTAMDADNGKSFRAVATLTKGGRPYSASFSSDGDLPARRK